ncbi:hypothetical protein FACS189456_7380 [Bacteroidia bacterium]|nr:hypothetical protein FACS189456_7380 [Bacteroidia bacterium]
MAYKEMTLKEKLAIVVRSVELENAGQPEEADRVWKQIPLAPYLAKSTRIYLVRPVTSFSYSIPANCFIMQMLLFTSCKDTN